MEHEPKEFSIRFHGGAEEVTGSRHLVSYGESRILLDCGLYQGHRQEALMKTRSFPTDPRLMSAVLLSHAHIDHSGGLPLLVKEGFEGSIHCTAPTAELLRIMLMDSAILQEEDAKFFNKIHAAQGQYIEPLYTREDVERTLGLLNTHSTDETFSVVDGVEGEFLNAGHVLGSAMVHLTVKTLKRTRHVLFTGDLGRRESVLMMPPKIPAHVDYLLIESTYGGRVHPPVHEAEDFLANVINRSEKEGGPILIPAFALERTQELVYLLEKLLRQHRIKPIHIYVDSPMAADITDIFQNNLDQLVLPKEGNPFGMGTVRYVRSVEESKRIMNTPGRKIIMAGSGMCEGGRILHHLRNLVGLANTTILIVGYQAMGTLGRRLVEGNRKIKIFGLTHDVAAEVQLLNHLSSHADQEDLAWFVRSLSPRPANIFLVHGETSQREALRDRLKTDGVTRVSVPQFGEVHELD